MYVLFNALDGFHKLFQEVGYFRIEEDLICMDKDGRVKVWLNPDLSKCHPMGSPFGDPSHNHKSERLETQMVDEIISIIETNTCHETEQ